MGRRLWADADGVLEHFIELAYDQANLFLLCRKHHDEIDRARREHREPRLVALRFIELSADVARGAVIAGA